MVIVKRDRIEITDKVYFAYDSDRILPKSYELLDNVAKVINEHTEIPVIFVEGHTDSDGNDAYNLQLSDRRAKSVMRYLTETGKVETERVRAKGFGETQPIAENTSEAGKAANRRVEFRIVDKDGEASDMTGQKFKAEGDGARDTAEQPTPATPSKAGKASPGAGDADEDDEDDEN